MAKTLRLILGDQLNLSHSWYKNKSDDIIYFMAEMRQETDYVQHHIQKVCAFFISMRTMANQLKEDGNHVIYYKLDDKNNTQSLVQNIKTIIKDRNIKKFEYQLPDECRLDQQLQQMCSGLTIETETYDTEHFLTSRTDLTEFFKGKKSYIMEYFYRDMRKKYDLLMLPNGEPEGGKWNFDKSNRNKWDEKTTIPPPFQHSKDVTDLINTLENQGVNTIGHIKDNKLLWPTSRAESLEVLDYFTKHLLPHFGDFQDAMHTDQQYLFHSRLSFAMNSKMVSPLEVVETVIAHWRNNQDAIEISQVEGFIRQIIGWREYMRGLYWKEMPAYESFNKLENSNPLPDFYWTGDTKMQCMKSSINQSLDLSYAHHIQRLMITGNYALLTMCDPDEVDAWYLGIYIDAIQWVELTNTRGMSQYADGGIVATKPYVSSGSYINKMSNYCKNCSYKVSKKTEEDACPFNALYWNFLDEKREYFKGNQRMSMMMTLLNKMEADKLAALKERAKFIINNPDKI